MAIPKIKPRNIKYLNKDFTSFRENLIEFSKTYFPKTYSDFNEASPGMLFIEMASYIGDVLSFYVDDSLKESLMIHATDKANVISLAQYLGYVPKVTSPATTTLTVYQLVPTKTLPNGEKEPDERYYIRIQEGMQIESSSRPNVRFVTTDVLDFSDPTDREIEVYGPDPETGADTFLVKKKIQAISAEIREETFTFNEIEPFSTIHLRNTDIIDILDIRDANNNLWYKVPYLAQEMVFTEYPNTTQNDPDLSQFRESVPNIIRLLKTSRRYTLKVNEDSTTTITFGTGDPGGQDELIIPTFKNVGLGTRNSISQLGQSFDPTNFLKTTSYGQAPFGDMTVRYLVGGGVESNVPAGDLTRVVSIEFNNDFDGLDNSLIQLATSVERSIAVENEQPATGGRGAETLEEIRENSLANFSSQNRAVTKKDYVVRALSMPSRYGSVTKAYASADSHLDNNSPASVLRNVDALDEFTEIVKRFQDRDDASGAEIKRDINEFLNARKRSYEEKNNPFAINLYLLGYNQDKHLCKLNPAVKENLKTYLNEHRILTDGINIIDGFIVNIGIEFDILVYPNYNKREVLLNCIQQLRTYFDIDNWTFNMPINISEVEVLLAGIEGVSSVPRFKVNNKCMGNYEDNSYDIEAATRDNIVYPSLDPCIFEVRFPTRDIKGRAL